MNKSSRTVIYAVQCGALSPKKLLSDIKIQETNFICARKYKTTTPEQILSVGVAGSLDFSRRASAWPEHRTGLEQHPHGSEMFKVASEALAQFAKRSSGRVAPASNKNKLFHSFGMFQDNIHLFRNGKVDKDFFLSKGWAAWKGVLSCNFAVLKEKIVKLYVQNKYIFARFVSVCHDFAYNQDGLRNNWDKQTKKIKKYYNEIDELLLQRAH